MHNLDGALEIGACRSEDEIRAGGWSPHASGTSPVYVGGSLGTLELMIVALRRITLRLLLSPGSHDEPSSPLQNAEPRSQAGAHCCLVSVREWGSRTISCFEGMSAFGT